MSRRAIRIKKNKEIIPEKCSSDSYIWQEAAEERGGRDGEMERIWKPLIN